MTSRIILETSIQTFLSLFVDMNASFAEESLASSSMEHFSSHYNKIGSQQNAISNTIRSITLSSSMLQYIEFIDLLASYCFVLLSETPPHLKPNLVERDIRRMAGRQSMTAAGGLGNTLQMDIERLFSQRVKIFSSLLATSGSEMILGTILKVYWLVISCLYLLISPVFLFCFLILLS
jgi:hypothetical protein